MIPKWLGMVLCVAAVIVAMIAEVINSPKLNSLAIIILAIAIIVLNWRT